MIYNILKKDYNYYIKNKYINIKNSKIN